MQYYTSKLEKGFKNEKNYQQPIKVCTKFWMGI